MIQLGYSEATVAAGCKGIEDRSDEEASGELAEVKPRDCVFSKMTRWSDEALADTLVLLHMLRTVGVSSETGAPFHFTACIGGTGTINPEVMHCHFFT